MARVSTTRFIFPWNRMNYYSEQNRDTRFHITCPHCEKQVFPTDSNGNKKPCFFCGKDL